MSVKSVTVVNRVRRTTGTVIEEKKGRKTKDELRAEYRDIQRQFLMWVSKETLDAVVRSRLAQIMAKEDKKKVTPALWVRAIKCATVKCDKCPGDGIYRWGAVVNGKATKSGPCYHCGGKGRMDAADCARTGTYYNHVKVI